MDSHTQLSWIYNLYRIGQRTDAESPGQVRQAILDHVMDGFDAASGCLALCDSNCCLTRCDSNCKQLSIATVSGLPETVIGNRIGVGDGVLGQVATSREPLLLNGDLSDDPRVVARGGHQRPDSAMCWPLMVDRRLIGTLSINRHGGGSFTEDDLAQGQVLVDMISVVIENARLNQEQKSRIAELSRLNSELKTVNDKLAAAQSQLLQSEKLAAIGQLAAGVAHEINNPVGYINANLASLGDYLGDLFELLEAYSAVERLIAADPASMASIEELKGNVDLDFLRDDTGSLVAECREGIARVLGIVRGLKGFAHSDDGEWDCVDLHQGLDATLNMTRNETKYKADVCTEYGDLPPVECLPGQLNQVFMNLLVNAVHAIEDHGTITVRTGSGDDEVWVSVSDTGSGILPEHRKNLFEPFFTTKPVGKGTGLGLSVSHGIIERHHGRIEVDSEVGRGTTFRVVLPIRQVAQEGGGD